jgi:hypothetical protein
MGVLALLASGSGVVSHGEIISSSIVSTVTVTCSLIPRAIENGTLCGRGERSIGSEPNPGEEDGTGGVLLPSHLMGGVVAPSVSLVSGRVISTSSHGCLPLSTDNPKIPLVNSDRRGVGS